MARLTPDIRARCLFSHFSRSRAGGIPLRFKSDPHPSPFLHDPGRGGRHKKMSGRWVGGIPGPGRKGATPPLHAIPPPPLSCTGGAGCPPPLAGHSTRNTPSGTGRHGGWSPHFLPDRGGGGRFTKKENLGEGGGNNSGGHPPCPEILGRGGGSGAGIFWELPSRYR